MRQRVAIAGTLTAGPEILLMGESFGALDAQTRQYVQVELRRISRIENKTVIFVTHDVEEAIFLADRLVIFSSRSPVMSATSPTRQRSTRFSSASRASTCW